MPFKFDLEAKPQLDGDFIEVAVSLELENGDRTRWTCGGMSRVSPPVAGIWMPVGLAEDTSQPEKLLELTPEEALTLANQLYAACGLTEVPDDPETRDMWDAAASPIDRDQLLEFFGTYDKISLERHPRQITRVGAVSEER